MNANQNKKKKSVELRYVALARKLTSDIQKGKYPIGSLLPTEVELTRKYSISRFTVREAIRQMQIQGLVIRRQGVGTRVLSDHAAHTFIQARNSVEEVLQYGVQSLLKDMALSNVRADGTLAGRIGCSEGEKFLKIAGLRMPVEDPQGSPVCWTEIFVLSDFAKIRNKLERGNVLIANLIEENFGVRAVEIQQDMTAVSLTGDISKKLGVSPSSPGLLIRRWYVGQDGRAFETTYSLHPGERFRYSMRLRRDAP